MDFTCPCFATVAMNAYLDQNENGKRDAYEPPLEGVRFWLEWYEPVDLTSSRKETASAWSDATGHAERKVYGCGCDDVDVYPEVPAGYKLTTPERCGSGACIFGFAALPGTLKSLSEADLHGADLQGQNLRLADLSGADLRDANLRGADLSSADLSGADLRGADLKGTDLSEASLEEADLHEARYVQDTMWPAGFDPVAAGAVLEE